MTVIAPLLQRGDELRRALRQNNVAIEHDGVTAKVDRFFRFDIDQVSHMLADRPLAVIVECWGKPDRAAIGQRAETSIEMIKAGIDQFDRDDESAEPVSNGAMRLYIGAEFVTAEQPVPSEKRISFTFEIKILWQPNHFVT